ncbi:MAG: hypothetical protein ACE5IO_02985 [Thermoplasmata archaeon]
MVQMEEEEEKLSASDEEPSKDVEEESPESKEETTEPTEETKPPSEKEPPPSEEEPPPSEKEEPSKPKKKWVKSALLVLRDVGIALLIVLLVFLALWAYAGVWPPMVVVESDSMQHENYVSHVGVIDTGDLVLVQHVDNPLEIETYVRAKCNGHSTYGDYGDVIIYNMLGGGDKPIIHRALIWLKINTTTNDSFDIPDLECSKWELGVNWWSTNITVTEPRNLRETITLRLVSDYRDDNFSINLRGLLTNFHENQPWTGGGFVAMGDHNPGVDGSFIRHDWVIGRARGELPWFGLIKLAVTGEVPWGSVCQTDREEHCATDNSWTSLTITLILLIVVPISLDIGLGFYQKWKEKKKGREPEKKEEEEEPLPPEQRLEGVISRDLAEKKKPDETPREEPSEETAEETTHEPTE